jgi:NDP-sugar pyrophosphorylase family protein
MSRAVILAGGRGTRLHPFTIALPKPLVPIGDQPILEIVIRQLIACGFSHVTLAVNHQAEIIRAYFGDGGRWNIKIDYSVEKKPLSTMAPLRLIPDLPDDFLVMNGDVLTDLAFMGVYCVNKKVLDLIPDGEAFGFDQLMLKMIADRQRVRIVVHDGYWLDIGRPDDYQKALEDWPKLRTKLKG